MISTPQTNGTNSVQEYLKNKKNQPITKNKIDSVQALRNVVQSLYKYKHDQGTPQHFTTEQIDNTQNGDVRLFGLNLNDVDSITEGLNDYLSIDNVNIDEAVCNKSLLKLFAPIRNTDASNGANPTSGSILQSNSISSIASDNTENVDLKGSDSIAVMGTNLENECELTTKDQLKQKEQHLQVVIYQLEQI